MRPRRSLPYWLEGGSEQCPACEHTYVLEMECRCVACDRGICIHCVVRAFPRTETFCPDCWAEERAR